MENSALDWAMQHISSGKDMGRHYDNWLTAYTQYTKNTEAPAHFHIWVGLFTIASVLARNVYIPMGAFDWVPNFYLFLIGEPGIVTKSTSIRMGESLLRKTGKVHFGSTSSTWQSLVDEMASSKAAHWSTGQPVCATTLTISELGSFLDLENRAQIDFMVDVWDAQRTVWTHSTIGRGKKSIENPCLNIIAATTPQWIRTNFKQSMVGGGLSSRTLMVLGKKKRRAIAYPGFEGNGLDVDMQDKLVEDLLDMSELTGEMQMTPEAIEWGTQWYNDLVNRPEFRKLQGERFQGYYARKQTHLHKIAIVLSVATGNSMVITEKHLQAANGFLDSMEKDYGQVLEYVQAGTAYSSAKIEISRIIQEKGSIDKTALYGEVSTVVAGHDFEKIMGDLVKANLITQLVTAGKVKVTWKSNTGTAMHVSHPEPQDITGLFSGSPGERLQGIADQPDEKPPEDT